MYLKKSYNRKTGRTQLFIVEAYRDKDKKPKSKVIKTLGYLDVLEKEYEDPIAYYSELAKRMTKEKKATIEKIRQNLLDSAELSAEPVHIVFGLAALIRLYNDIGFGSFFSEFSNETRTDYNLNSIFRFAVCAKALFPAMDEKIAIGMRTLFNTDSLTMSDYYRILDFITKHKSELLSWLYERLKNTRDISNPIFYYFSSFSYGYGGKNLGKLTDMFYPLKDDNILFGLFSDENGLPLGYTFLYDNASAQKLYSSFADQLSEYVTDRRVVTVAGSMSTNFTNYISHVLKHNAGYIVAYPLKLADKDLKAYALTTKRDGFKVFSFKDFASVSSLGSLGEPFISDFQNNELLYTEHLAEKTFFSYDKSINTMHEKQIFIYSPSYAEKCGQDRAALLSEAESIIAEPQNYNRSTAHAAGRYIKDLRFDKNGSIALPKSGKMAIDYELASSEARLDGYIVILTSEYERGFVDICKNMLSLAFTDIYFSKNKPAAGLRSEVMSSSTLAQMDFLFSFIGLFLCRQLEEMLNYRFSASEILESLKKCDYINIENDIYMLNYRDEVLEALSEVLDIDFTKKFRRLRELKELVR